MANVFILPINNALVGWFTWSTSLFHEWEVPCLCSHIYLECWRTNKLVFSVTTLVYVLCNINSLGELDEKRGQPRTNTTRANFYTIRSGIICWLTYLLSPRAPLGKKSYEWSNIGVNYSNSYKNEDFYLMFFSFFNRREAISMTFLPLWWLRNAMSMPQITSM